MKAWLLTYNPDNWTWPNFEADVADAKSGKHVIHDWQCASKQVEIGDRVFITQTGNKARGIFASGHVKIGSHDAPHYNAEKASQGVVTPHIEIDLDWILNPTSEKIINTDVLNSKIPNQTWSPQNSGISIKDDAFFKLEMMWARLIKIENDAYNLLKVYPDIDQDKHDGSYELVREVVNSYASLDTLDNLSLLHLLVNLNLKLYCSKWINYLNHM